MAEKKSTTKTGTSKATSTKKASGTKTATSKKAVLNITINAENVGFRAGDVYQTLFAADKALSVEQIAELSGKSVEEVLLGIGWLFKEGKIKDDNQLIALA